jgi:hypothetical protein
VLFNLFLTTQIWLLRGKKSPFSPKKLYGPQPFLHIAYLPLTIFLHG